VDREKLNKLIKEYGLEEINDYIKENTRNTMGISINEKEDYKKIGNCRIAGFPDSPQEIEWPRTEEGNLMTFILQLNMSEVGLMDKTNLMPKTGMLYFFMGIDEPAYNIEHKVIYVDDTSNLKLVNTDETTVLEETYDTFIGHKVDIFTSLDIPNYAYVDYEIFKDEKLADAYYEFCDDLKMEIDIGQIYGYPQGQHADCEIESALKIIANKEYDFYHTKGMQILTKYLNNNEEKAKEEVNDIVMLLEIDSSDEVGFCWWDCGVIHFFIRKEDLINRRFDKTYLSLYSS
jgi:uncharacterized protein YwqG